MNGSMASGETNTRQEIQVVQDLGESEEAVASNPIENEVSNEVLNVASAEKPTSAEKPASDEKPIETNDVNDKPVNTNDPNPINKFCSCSSTSCKCCRDFSIPLVPIRGPGCATVKYLDNDRLSLAIKYGDFILASRQVDSRRPTPIWYIIK